MSESNCKFEDLFIAVRPRVLPRPRSIIIVDVIYCLCCGAANNKELCDCIRRYVDTGTTRTTILVCCFLNVCDLNVVETRG